MEYSLEDHEEQRRFMRFEPLVPIIAQISIANVRSREVASRSQNVLVGDIGFGGCRFLTHLRIPPRDDVEWLFKLQLGRGSLSLRAVVVRASNEEMLYSYGAKWKMTELERQHYQFRLNEHLHAMLVSSPHILTLYKLIMDRRDDGRFKKLDVRA